MLISMLRFELRYFLRQPSFYVVSLVLFLASFFSVTSSNVVIGGGGEVFKNSPYAIAQTLLILSLFAMFLVVNFVGSGAVRNAQHQMEELIYTKPLQAFNYQFGRFFGSYLVVLLVYLAVPLGMLLGSFMPWVDASRFGPNNLYAYWYNFIVLSAPGLFVMSALFYAAAVRFRSLMPLYLIALVLVVLYLVSGTFASLPEYRTVAALMDPFGLRTFADVTRYWTIQEKNSQLVELAGVLLQNRLLWLAIAVALLAMSGLFRLPKLQTRDSKKPKAVLTKMQPVAISRLQQKASNFGGVSALWCRIKFEMRQVLWTAPFFILIVISLTQLIGPMFADLGWYGTSDWPVTQSMVMYIIEAMSLLIIIVTVYYSAEVVWRERNSGMGDIIDSMPVANVTFWIAKLLAVAAVLLLLMLLGMVCTIGYQLLKGVADVELSQYLIRLGYQYWLPMLLTVVLAFFLQVLSPNKFIGMGLFVGYYLLSLVLANWGLGHSLINFANSPNVGFSDLNQYGPNLVTHSWYMLYWGAISLLLFTLGYGLYHRGPLQSLKQRWRKLGYQLGRAGKTLIAASLLLAVASGGFLYQQTTILNTYQTEDQRRDLQAAYEKQLKQYAELAFPVTTKVDATLDLYPEQQKIVAKVALTWQNKSDQPIDKVLVNWPENTAVMDIHIAGSSLSERDNNLRTSWLTFTPALQPGQTVSGEIELVRQSVGLRETNFDSAVVANGTFINNKELLPGFGYQQDYELRDRHERLKRDLPPRERANKLEDSRFYQQNFFGPDGDFIQFAATVSTAGDQTAITPGYLQRQWQQDGRNYFRYEMDQPMVNFYSISSGRYAVKQQQHNGVSIEVYYHPAHSWNVDRMMESVRDSLDYFSAEFGPYQHKQMRIIEFPGYRGFAQSFANTVPYSERIGFITDLRNPDNIDPVYYVTAHEVAHQWWGHQVGAADVQGSAVISESLSQYAALMVMQHKYGADKIRKFIKHELDDYLRGRSAERIAEMPLLCSESQSYIHYQKGSVVMMAIKDLLGEARLNANLKAFNQRYRFRNDPFPTTLDLLQYLTLNTSTDEAAFIRDQFENITLYDLRLQQASAKQLNDGRYQITLQIYADKLRADERGNQSSEPMQQQVSIGLFSADPNKLTADGGQLYLQRHLLQSGDNQLQIVLDQLPTYAGVDPYINLIDRDSADNIRRIQPN